MQLAGSGNGTLPCHRPITEHAGIEHGGSCLATVTVELYGGRRGRELQGWGGDGGGGGGSSGGGGVGGGALRDQSLQQYITTQLPTPPTIRCPPLPSNNPPTTTHTHTHSLPLVGTHSLSEKQKHTLWTETFILQCYTI